VFDLFLKDHNLFQCNVAVIASNSIKDLLKLTWDVIISHSLKKGNFSANFWIKLGSANDQKFTV